MPWQPVPSILLLPEHVWMRLGSSRSCDGRTSRGSSSITPSISSALSGSSRARANGPAAANGDCARRRDHDALRYMGRSASRGAYLPSAPECATSRSNHEQQWYRRYIMVVIATGAMCCNPSAGWRHWGIGKVASEFERVHSGRMVLRGRLCVIAGWCGVLGGLRHGGGGDG